MSFEFSIGPGQKVVLEDCNIKAEKRTRYQHVQLVAVPFLGEIIFLDGFPQVGLADEYIFNELLIHPTLLSVSNPEVVVVAGIGCGANIREVLKHPTVKKVFAIDIDQEAVALYMDTLSYWNNDALRDDRVELLYMDARTFLAEQAHGESIDSIIVDLPDPFPLSPSSPLYTDEFYRLAADRLRPGGSLMTQAGRFRVGSWGYHATVRQTLGSVFQPIRTYWTYYPSYFEPWSFVLAPLSGWPFASSEQVDRELEERGISDLKFYSGAVDAASATLPRCYLDEVERHRTRSFDRSPASFVD